MVLRRNNWSKEWKKAHANPLVLCTKYLCAINDRDVLAFSINTRYKKFKRAIRALLALQFNAPFDIKCSNCGFSVGYIVHPGRCCMDERSEYKPLNKNLAIYWCLLYLLIKIKVSHFYSFFFMFRLLS